MACGVPVIGSDSGSIPDVMGDAGIVFREGKVKELARGIARLKENKGVREGLMQKGHARAAERFSWGRIAQDAMELFDSVMEKQNRGRIKRA